MADCVTVTVLVKKRFIPARSNDDVLMIGNLTALKCMCQCIQKERNNLWDEAKKYEAQAVQLMNEELGTFQGDGEVVVPQYEPYGLGVCGVENLL